MHRYKKIMVGLDLTPMDKTVAKYAAMTAKLFGAEKVYFVHIRSPYVLPLVFEADFPKNLERLEHSDINTMHKAAATYFKDSKIKIEYALKEGSVMSELLKFSHEKKVDLIITGKGNEYTGSGMIPEKIARKANCDVLLVPKDAKPVIKNILVPVDFSSHSALALKQASALAGAANAKVIIQNIFYAPIYPITIGYSKKTFTGKIKELEEKRMNAFVKRYYRRANSYEKVFTMDDFDNMGQQINEYAAKRKADLIIAGSRGKTNAAAVLVGSTAENIIRKVKNIPILIIKKKNENLGVLKLWFS